ncbi:MAG: GYD domain-containing protein [Elusimicrobiota bacterium]
MATFFMFGKYSSEALKGLSAERTKKAVALIEKSGGKVDSMYALLGEYDLVLIVNLPGIADAMKVSVELNKLTGISFSTVPALTVEQFDKLTSGK